MEQTGTVTHVRAADGHDIPAVLMTCGAERLIIMSHGITGDKDEEGVHYDFATESLNLGFDTVRFDFRGHGQSGMPPRDATVSGRILDLMAIMRWARSFEYKEVFHVATSFGASITLLSAKRFSMKDFSAVVFWNPVIDYEHTFIRPRVEWARKFFNQEQLEELAFKEGTSIPKTNIVIGPQMAMELLNMHPQDTVWPSCLPLLIVHGDRDTCTPYEDVIEYCRANPGVVKLHTIHGVDHGFDDKIREAYSVTLDWFAGYSGDSSISGLSGVPHPAV
jgi:pimeloyl-ACP methyl ester carboxylesterase